MIQPQHKRLVILVIILILVIGFILLGANRMIHNLDEQMPVIGLISLDFLQQSFRRLRFLRRLIVSTMALIFLTCFTSSGHAQVTISGSGGSADGSYTTLKLAFDALNAVSTQAGNTISVTITANVTDNNTAVLNQPSVSTWTSLSISPSGGSWTLSGSVNAPLISLNGADLVTINGLNAEGNALTISNTSTSSVSGTSTIRMINDAMNNTITNCSILGSSTGNAAQSGTGTIPATSTILIGGSNSTNGNDNNSITNNTIAEAGTNLPTVGISSSGQSTSISNDLVIITGNNIANFYGANGGNGIAVASNSSAFTISSNKFYQTSAKNYLGYANLLECIFINTSNGGGYVISDNTIGYADADGTGMLVNTFGRFAGIDLNAVAASPVSEIQGNTINGINWIVNYESINNSSNSAFYGILVRAGKVNVGTTTGNTIGSQTGTGSATTNVFITNNPYPSTICMIYINSANNCNISNNHLAAINISTGNMVFFGISIQGSGSHTVLSNEIGGDSAGSITVGAPGPNYGPCTFYGVHSTSTGNGVIGSIGQGNIIQHIKLTAYNYCAFLGIISYGNALSLNINYNTMHGIVFPTSSGSNFSEVQGIVSGGNVNNALNINHNHFGTAASGWVSFEQVAGPAHGLLYGISCSSLAPTATLSISNNDFRGIVYTGIGS